jgi:glycosyltransferase involved in cell wall biosynthesis
MLSAAQGLAQRGHQITLVCQPDSGLAQRARAKEFSTVIQRLRGDCDPLAMARLYHLIRRRRIQLVCGNMSKETRLAGLAAKLAGIPFIRRRGSDMPYPNKWRHRKVDHHLVHLIIANSRSTRNTLLQGNPWLSPEKLKLIYNGIPPGPEDGPGDKQEVLREFGLQEASPILAIVGLLKERKGHDTLFRALQHVSAEFPQVSLLVVGKGEQRESLEELARQLGIAQNVLFTGFRNDVSRLMSAMDILVLPSKNEGFGYVLTEAMNLGKPVVATRISSIPEVVREGETGLLVPPGDVDALAEALLELARHPARARQMGLAGRRRVRERFSMEKMLDDLEELFGGVIGSWGFRRDS